MIPSYVLDACAVVALINNEPGADIIDKIIGDAQEKHCQVFMNVINLLEVYYGFLRADGKDKADMYLSQIRLSGIIVSDKISEDVFREAGRLKATYKISLGDSLALAEASVSGDSLLTCDHHEFDIVEQSENISFYWIR